MVADPGLAKGGRGSASLNGGMGRAPQRGPRAEVVGLEGGSSPPETDSFFVHFYTKKWPQGKDLNENLTTCLTTPP